jgi:hypothetical protein
MHSDLGLDEAAEEEAVDTSVAEGVDAGGVRVHALVDPRQAQALVQELLGRGPLALAAALLLLLPLLLLLVRRGCRRELVAQRRESQLLHALDQAVCILQPLACIRRKGGRGRRAEVG